MTAFWNTAVEYFARNFVQNTIQNNWNRDERRPRRFNLTAEFDLSEFERHISIIFFVRFFFFCCILYDSVLIERDSVSLKISGHFSPRFCYFNFLGVIHLLLASLSVFLFFSISIFVSVSLLSVSISVFVSVFISVFVLVLSRHLYLYLECSIVHLAESVAHLGSVILMAPTHS